MADCEAFGSLRVARYLQPAGRERELGIRSGFAYLSPTASSLRFDVLPSLTSDCEEFLMKLDDDYLSLF